MKSSFSGRSHAQTITGGRSAKGFGGFGVVGRKARIEIGTSTTTASKSQSLFLVKNRMANSMSDGEWCPNLTLRLLCVLCVSAVYLFHAMFTAEAQRTQSRRRESLNYGTTGWRAVYHHHLRFDILAIK